MDSYCENKSFSFLSLNAFRSLWNGQLWTIINFLLWESVDEKEYHPEASIKKSTTMKYLESLVQQVECPKSGLKDTLTQLKRFVGQN